MAPYPPPCGEGGPKGRVGVVQDSAQPLPPPPRSASRIDPPRKGEGARAYAAAASVPDPEIPCVTVADLGILRSVEMVDGVAVARLTPTYSGCPAVTFIELAVEAALREAGFEPRIERVMSPAWTTDWITEEGREKLRAYGIAPPEKASGSIRSLFGEVEVACPKCGSRDTERVSEFGSTACKALYRCLSCREPFDYFKCI
jgi:ring-1,2-phenylacetyl-CoA epoxidase subunit PaaD